MNFNYQLQNQMSDEEEFAQMLSSCISYDDGYLSSPNGSSPNMWGTSINISHSVAHHQGSQFVHGESSSGTKIKDTSLIADANSPFSGVSYLPGNGGNNINIFTNCGIVSCTVRENSPAQQQNFQPGQIYPKRNGRQGDQLPSPTYSPQMMMPANQASITPFMKYKKPRIEMTPEIYMHSFSVPQLSPSQVPMQFRSYDPVTGSRLHQQNMVPKQQQNQSPLSVLSTQRHPMQSQPPHQLTGDVLKQLTTTAAVSGSICLRQLVFFIHHRQNRPPENNIGFWREFVKQYYSPMAKKRLCVSMTSMFNRDRHQKLWMCDLCGSNAANAGKGFETSYELLPRMSQVYFKSCVEDELLYLDSPVETILPSGSMMLTFNKAVQQSIYKNIHVAHQGQLRIVFTPELKIISWEFCVRSHEELVNELVEIAKQCKSNGGFNERNGVQAQDQVTSSNRLMAAGQNLAANLELPHVNEAGFSKVYVRYMQMSDVLNSMKDLIGMCADSQSNNFSPTEALKSLHRESVLKNHIESIAQMPQTPSANGNILVSNITTQSPNTSKQAMLNPRSYQSPNIRPLSYSVPYKPLYSLPGSPNSHQQGPTVMHQINDLLARTHTNGTLAKGGSQSRAVYAPKIGTQAAESAELTKADAMLTKVNTSVILGGMADKGKGFNYSSGSNSSARIFADNCLVKREPLSDDDTTSNVGHHRVEKK
ncbi:probable transcriptional regulator SLK2 [Chenopodium quinoa]|uniref:probable transcriptional regulator SLK2 n=1 Tax=Chenopodium quinoa TaxID=63459 RepID=UPI000B78D1D8|nr:probable transcriptional regulator SLK2 [Chenopodium quinoa]